MLYGPKDKKMCPLEQKKNLKKNTEEECWWNQIYNHFLHGWLWREQSVLERLLCKKYVAEDGKREMISQNYN